MKIDEAVEFCLENARDDKKNSKKYIEVSRMLLELEVLRKKEKGSVWYTTLGTPYQNESYYNNTWTASNGSDKDMDNTSLKG